MTRWFTTLVLIGLSWALWPQLLIADDHRDEYQVKAVLINKILDFVSWPKGQASGDQVLCVAGVDPFGEALDAALAARSGVSVKRLDNASLDLESCQVLWLSASERRSYRDVLDILHAKPILTVSDIPHFANNGGMINLALINRRVRFVINQQEIELSGIKVSYKLLRLADLVNPQSEERSG